MSTYKLSLIIPVYNAAGFVTASIQQVMEWKKELDYPVQVVLVNDGSSDNTDAVIKALIDNYPALQPDFLLCSYKQNQGKGHAIKTGILQSSGEFCIFTDADIPFGLGIIDRFLHYLDFKEFDIVVGDRTLKGSVYKTEISGIRKFGSNIFTFIAGRFVAGGVFDTQCGIKGFRRTVVQDLFPLIKTKGFAFDVETLYIALKRNYDIKRIPVVLTGQEGSSVNVLKHGPGMTLDLFKIVYRYYTGQYEQKDFPSVVP